MGFGSKTQMPIKGSQQFYTSSTSIALLDVSSGNHGCKHYRRRCKIRAPCCNDIYDCRHCHNEAKNGIKIDPMDRHDIPRHHIKKVICSLCGEEQDVQQNCVNCGVLMGNYFCSECNFFDDDVSKKQYHCDQCGICRTGGKENFFHCSSCGCCYPMAMKGTHRCLEKAMHHNCPVCCEYLFDTTKEVSVLLCGHTMHLECAKEMEQHYRFKVKLIHSNCFLYCGCLPNLAASFSRLSLRHCRRSAKGWSGSFAMIVRPIPRCHTI
ncbi:hypothetical protein KSS87_008703 [Heliosperma pusillum]|nr:hypothetical protein KSS87_008703 [Heliosperma pusillum]